MTRLSRDQVQSEILKLYQSFLHWRCQSVQQRKLRVQKILIEFEKNKNEGVKLIHQSMHKPLIHAEAEYDKSLQALRYWLELDLTFLEQPRLILSGPRSLVQNQVFYKPCGVILGLMPWNYPLWQAVRMIFPTLLAGNTIYLKHSEITPEVGQFIHDMFVQAGASDLLFHGMFEHTVTEEILSWPQVGGVSLTGSVRAGELLAKWAGQNLKKSVMELGGSDAYLILKDADLESSLKKVLASRMINSGQTCISAKRLFVPLECKDKVLLILDQELQKYTYSMEEYELQNLNSHYLLGPLADRKFFNCYESIWNEWSLFFEVQKSYMPSTKGVDPELKKLCVPLRYGAFTLPLSEPVQRLLKDEEIFAPGLLIFFYNSLDEALTEINNTSFGLGGAIFSENLSKATEVALKFETGLVSINDFVKSDVAVPFGGIKKSGLGRELGLEGFTAFTDLQVISIESKTSFI